MQCEAEPVKDAVTSILTFISDDIENNNKIPPRVAATQMIRLSREKVTRYFQHNARSDWAGKAGLTKKIEKSVIF